MIYFWTEDSGAGFEFWKTYINALYADLNIEVESKRNNSELVKAINNINDTKNLYIIAMDNVYDNESIQTLIKMLTENIKYKSNIIILKMVSFEFMILSFEQLIDWVFNNGSQDPLYASRESYIEARNVFIASIDKNCHAITDYKSLTILQNELEKIKEYTAEKVASVLLHKITRNTGFHIDKGELGQCYKIDCSYDEETSQCEYSRLKGENEPKPEDCGLRNIKEINTVKDKMACMQESIDTLDELCSILRPFVANNVYEKIIKERRYK